MRRSSRLSAAVGVVVLLGLSSRTGAQGVPQADERVAALTPGSIGGVVQDEKGAAVSGAAVSAVGVSSAFALTNRSGRFELPTLSPGPYVVRAHLNGFIASLSQIVEVRSGTRATSSIELRRAADASAQPRPIVTAGVGVPISGPGGAEATEVPAGKASGSADVDDDHGEVAWRLRHARRGVLKDVTLPGELLAGSEPPPANFGQLGFFGRTAGSSARAAASLFSSTPFSGQFDLLATDSFDTPQELFSPDSFSRSIAYLSVGAPVGEHADWTVRGALTQGDISSWIFAAAYSTRAPARHRYDAGMSYGTQHYEGGNLAALRDVAEGSRNVGTLYAFDTFAISPAVSVTYGARVARYDYLERPGLISPRASVTISQTDRLRVSAVVSRRAVAPGAEEFVPPAESAIWLPPQRTFSSLVMGRGLDAERNDHVELEVERDLGGATVSARTFRQHVADQIATVFGLGMPDAPAHLGHYFVSKAGDVDASGWGAGVRASFTQRVHGSVQYSATQAHWNPSGDEYLVVVAPSAARIESERLHDVSTTVETNVPETATRVLVLYRMSNAFAAASARPGFDARFDVQVRQSLPFMDFSSAKWEMLLAVRNMFREVASDASVYDELLVVRPPKRIVGGLTLKF